MISFPNCKINFGLHICNKRVDGFHNIETIFYPIALTDVLEIVEQKNNLQEIEFTSSGLPILGSAESNLCIKAYHLLKKDFPKLPYIKMHLHKVIPMGAGLGGGSADAAFTLNLLNEKFNLKISTEKLINYSLQLGSDCPFFIKNHPCFATGRGEVLTPISINLNGFHILLVNPNIHINTSWAFSQITPQQPLKNIKNLILEPISEWKNNLLNDFEKPINIAYPEIQNIKNWMYKNDAIYATMSGSGSTVFGIFNQPIATNFTKDYFVKWIKL